MHANANDLPIVFQAGDVSIRAMDWNAFRALLITLPAGADATPLLRGLPGDRCQCPHWGYVRKGRLTVRYGDSDESFSQGDVYYMPAGHTIIADDDVELIEFSPPDEYDTVLDALRANAGT